MNDEATDASASLPPGRLPQRVGRRLAALGLVGGLMVALPLLQVLRYQSAELQVLMAERASLDPTAKAVDVQRGLLLHRDLSSQVLRGDDSAEAERKLRQGEVDDHVGALAVALVSGQWERAVHESDALREDWSLLARQIGSHGLSAEESERGHRLLVEQVLQVIDLVADTSPPRSAQDGATQASLSVSGALPRLSWQIAALADRPAGDEESWQRELAAAESGLARTLGVLNATLEREPRPELAAAGAAAGATADRYFQLVRQARNRDTGALAELPRALAMAQRAQFRLFTQAQADARTRIAVELNVAAGQRNQWLIGTAVFALLLLGVVNSLVRSLREPGPHAPDAAHRSNPHTTAGHGEADRLLQRLREGDAAASRRTRPEPQPTMPGEL